MTTISKVILKDGTIKWRAQVRLKGHKPVSLVDRCKTKVERRAQKIEVEIRDGRYFKTAEAKKHTLRDVISRYERDVLPDKPRAKQDQQLHWWKQQLGDHSLADITPGVVRKYQDQLRNTITRFGKKMASTTVLRYLAALSHVFSIAISWELTEINPVKPVVKPKIGQLRARVLSDDERERLMVACRESSNAYVHAIVVLALATGMRKSEILTLTWASVDWSTGDIVLEHTKNGERRRVPLSQHALGILRGLLQGKRQNIQYIFPSHDGRKPIDFRSAWEQALRKAGIKDFRFHDLRHSCASYHLVNGTSPLAIAEILGHKSLQMVKRYAHASASHLKAEVSKMNEKIFGGT